MKHTQRPNWGTQRAMRQVLPLAVALAVAAAACTSSGSQNESTTTTAPIPPTTAAVSTTVAGLVDAEAQEAAELVGMQMLKAREAWDSDAAMELLAIGASVDVGPAERPSELPLEMAFQEATGLLTTPTECVADPEARNDGGIALTCTGMYTTAVSVVAGRPYEVAEYEMIVSDGMISSIEMTELENYNNTNWMPFQHWVRRNHQDDVGTLYTNDGGGVALNLESIALWALYTEEFVAEAQES